MEASSSYCCLVAASGTARSTAATEAGATGKSADAKRSGFQFSYFDASSVRHNHYKRMTAKKQKNRYGCRLSIADNRTLPETTKPSAVASSFFITNHLMSEGTVNGSFLCICVLNRVLEPDCASYRTPNLSETRTIRSFFHQL